MELSGILASADTPFDETVNTFSTGVNYKSILTVLSIMLIYPRWESSGTISTNFRVSTPNSGLAVTVDVITAVASSSV